MTFLFSKKNNGFSDSLLNAVREASAKGPMARNALEAELMEKAALANKPKKAPEQIDEAKKLIGTYTHGSNATKVYKLSGEHNEGDPYHVEQIDELQSVANIQAQQAAEKKKLSFQDRHGKIMKQLSTAYAVAKQNKDQTSMDMMQKHLYKMAAKRMQAVGEETMTVKQYIDNLLTNVDNIDISEDFTDDELFVLETVTDSIVHQQNK